jgi:hypothetical protein
LVSKYHSHLKGIKNSLEMPVPVAYAYNPRYSGSKNHEDHDLKLDWENLEKNPSQKGPGGVTQGAGPSSSPSTAKKKKKTSLEK